MPPANDDYRKRLAERKRLLARASQKQQREKAFSSPPKNMPEMVKPIKSIIERVAPFAFGGMGEEQAKAENKYRLAMMGADDSGERLRISSELNPTMRAFTEGYGGGGFAGSIRAASKPLGPKLAEQVSGISAKKRNLVDLLLEKAGGISIPSEPRRVVVETFEDTADIAKSLGPKMVSTAKSKSDQLRRDLLETNIEGKTLSEHMDNAGLGSFKSFDELSEEAGGSVFGVVRPVLEGTQEAVNESLNIMRQMNPSGANISGILDPLQTKVSHIWENDHAASGSVGKQLIVDSAAEILRGGGKLSDDWLRAADDLLAFVDDPQNLRAVSRWWNQAKSNLHPEEVLQKLDEKFPALAKHIRGPNVDQYLDYVVEQWELFDDMARNVPGATEVLERSGGLRSYSTKVKPSRTQSFF
jgi:hypothetical protein